MGIAITSSNFEVLKMCPNCGHKKLNFYGFKQTILTYVCLRCKETFLVVNDMFAKGRPPLPPYHTHYEFNPRSRRFTNTRDKRQAYKLK